MDDIEKLAGESMEQDALTGVYSREAAEKIVRGILSAETDGASALFLIDPDNFEIINEQLGIQAGNELLRRSAAAINGVFRSGDVIGRDRGDCFLVFLTGSFSKELVTGKARALLDALRFSVGKATLTVSVGVSFHSGKKPDFDRLYAEADAARCQAKAAGKHRFVLADGEESGLSGDAAGTVRSEAMQYQALLKYMRGGVFLADVGESIRVTYVSPGAIHMAEQDKTGSLSEDGGNALGLVYGEDLPALQAAAHRCAQTGELTELTYRVGADGNCWRHIRIARLTLMTDGSATVIGVLSDMTEFKRSEEALRQSEERYRIADELSRALIWEVDIATHTLYQSVETSRALGHSGSVYHNAPDGLLATGTIHPTSVADFRRMYADLYAGRDGGEYMILSADGGGGFVWLRAVFRLVRDKDGAPVRAIGIAEKMPGIGREMRIFEDERRFADAVSSSTLGVIRANLTKDTVESSALFGVKKSDSYSELCEEFEKTIFPGDAERISGLIRREALLRSAREGNDWLFLDFRAAGREGAPRWLNLAVNLLRNPVSGDLYAFGYLRDVDRSHRLAETAERAPERDGETLLYTRESMAELAAAAVSGMAENELCAMTVFEVTGLERIRKQDGAQTAQRLLFTIGRLCRIMIDGNVVIGHPSRAQFAVFRSGVVSAEQQKADLVRYISRSRLLMQQTSIDVSGDISCGFAVSGKKDFSFDELMKHATLACRIAEEQPDNPVTEYSDPGENLFSGSLPAAPAPAGKRKPILVADDDLISRGLERTILEREYDVDEAHDGEQALEMLRKKRYALLLCDIQMPHRTGWDVLAAMQAEKMLLDTPVVVITADGDKGSEVKALNLGASDVIVKPIVPEVLMSRARNIIGRQEAAAAMERNSLYELRFQQQATLLRQAEYDGLTGLFNKPGFFRRVRERLDGEPGTQFRLIRWDLDNFKMVNDTMGVEAGDRLLRDIGSAMQDVCCASAVFAHLEADHFVIFIPRKDRSPEDILREISAWFEAYPFDFKLSVHMGVYEIADPSAEVSVMCDRALLALKSVKSSFADRIGWYDESLRGRILEEQELSGEMTSALENGQFELYFQPQVNYASGAMIGAEALVRWRHPVKGLIPPGKFIPLFERNGFISTLDEYVWEQSCRYMRSWIDKTGTLPISVSVNISRVDIYDPRLCGHLRGLVRRYGLPPSALRLEITESAYMQNAEQLISVVRDLRDAGFTVEMDDFGAGYSSLNTLKDVPVNVLKLDIRFLSGSENGARGGNILSSVIRMAHWLDMPVIAEGVETAAQADYLKSLNCFYMQGYYFGKPMPAAEFEALLGKSAGDISDRFGSAGLEGIAAFWDPSAQTALLFNSFVDGAAILEYRDGNAEVLRANDKFYEQLGTTREAYLPLQKHTLDRFGGEDREAYRGMLEASIRCGAEAECEVRSIPVHAGGAPFWTHNRVRLLAMNADGYLFYLAVENITARKEEEERLRVRREDLQLALSRAGKTVCGLDIASRTLTVPEDYARRHRLPGSAVRVTDDFVPGPVCPDDRERFRAFFREILAGEPDPAVTVRLEGAEGPVRERYEAALVRGGGGKPVRAVICVEDVTARSGKEPE